MLLKWKDFKFSNFIVLCYLELYVGMHGNHHFIVIVESCMDNQAYVISRFELVDGIYEYINLHVYRSWTSKCWRYLNFIFTATNTIKKMCAIKQNSLLHTHEHQEERTCSNNSVIEVNWF